MIITTPEPTKKYKTVPIQALYDMLVLNNETGEVTWKWGEKSGRSAGRADKAGYRYVKILSTQIPEHRIVFAMFHGRWPDLEIDHINCNRSDNRPCNLREVTHRQNHMNKRRLPGTYFPKGVSKNGSGFKAQIGVNGVRISLGTYRTIEDAKAAYDKGAAQYFGEYARSA